MVDPAAHFWGRVRRGAADACWPWLAARRTPFGHGAVWFDAKVRQAHRVAFYLTHGRWPVVCRHTCDNPPCCNPAHLLDGTQADNVRDAVARGRHAAKLSADDVRWIRWAHSYAGVSHGELASAFSVTRANISYIIRREAWAHVA